MAEVERITLYAAVDSPFPHRVRLALEEAKATYDIIWVDLINKPKWYEEKVYPGEGRVPYLVYGGPPLKPEEAPSPAALKIHDSPTILQFVADLFPDAHLLPASAAARAQVRLFCLAIDKKLVQAWFPTVFMGAPTDGLFVALDEVQKQLPDAPGTFFFGSWTIADATILPILLRMEHNWRLRPFTMAEAEVERAQATWASPRFDRLRRYLEDCKARDSVRKTWDEESVAHQFGRRIERFRTTGVINKDLKLPIPVSGGGQQ